MLKSMELPKERLLNMYRDMLRIRYFEESVQELFVKKVIAGTTHLSSGQEGVSVGVCQALERSDYITCTYRGHGVLIARGSNLDSLMAEIFGKRTGICRGKGGSMHLTDLERGVIGSFAIVGAGIPIADGAALASVIRKENRISVSFFGDGAANIGAFHESLNLAGIWKLPVIFVCENNLYGEYTPISRTTPIADISSRAPAYGFDGVIVDGNDVLAVYQAAMQAREKASRGLGPTLIECKTYRFKGHSRTDPGLYRKKEEVDAWSSRDPIDRFRNYLVERNFLSESDERTLKEQVKSETDLAVEFATNSPVPNETDLCQDLYVGDE